ncbi:MAG: ABC transporter substrate-binding protein [Desulfobacterales bacterium]|nr:ABC transporter substrate-binding protein [Desulfobacterales bacterium]
MKTKQIVIASVVVIVLAFLVFLNMPSQSDREIQIGGIFSLTGKAAPYGEWIKNATELAIKDVNASGGVNGRLFTLISEDTQTDPKLAVSAFQKLIALNKIQVATGFVSSSEALACAPIAESSKVVMITPIAGSPELKEAGDYVFRTRESGDVQGYKIAEYIFNDLGHKEAAIIFENTANAVGYKDSFIEKFTELGGKIILSESYEEGQSTFRGIITKAESVNAKAVYVPGVAAIIGRVLKQSKELGLNSEFFSSAGIEDSVLFDIAGSAAEGLIYTSSAFSEDSSDEKIKTFVSAYQDQYGSAPTAYAANAYDTIMLIADAIKKQDSVDADKIKEFLYQVKDYHGVSGKISFDSYGEVTKPVMLKQVKGHGFVVIGEK